MAIEVSITDNTNALYIEFNADAAVEYKQHEIILSKGDTAPRRYKNGDDFIEIAGERIDIDHITEPAHGGDASTLMGLLFAMFA